MPQSTYSVLLDGSTGYIDLGTAVAQGTRLTVAAWVKWTGTPGGNQQIICRDNPAVARLYQWRVNTSGKLELIVFVGGSAFTCTGGTTLTAGSWYHLAGTFDGTTVKVYVNGTLDGSLSQGGNLDTGTADHAYIGVRNNSGFALFLDAKVDDVLIAGSDLGSSVISGLAAGTTDPTTLTLDGLWRLEEGTGTSTADGSGNGHAGTLVNGATWSTDVPSQLAGGGSTVTGTFTSAGVGVATFTGSATAAGTFGSSGVGTPSFSGAADSAGTFTSAGVGTPTFSGAADAAGTFSSAGLGTAAFTGSAEAAGVFSSAGVGAASFESPGGVEISATFTAAGVAAVAFAGASIAAATWTAAGSGSAAFLPVQIVSRAYLIGTDTRRATLTGTDTRRATLTGSMG